MLSCKNVADRASALIDGELSTWDALQMRLHLAMCKGCRRFVDQIRVTNHLTAKLADPVDVPVSETGEGPIADLLSTLRDDQRRR